MILQGENHGGGGCPGLFVRRQSTADDGHALGSNFSGVVGIDYAVKWSNVKRTGIPPRFRLPTVELYCCNPFTCCKRCHTNFK